MLAAKHQAHTYHSIGDVKRQVLQILNMDMHVPKPRDEKAAVGVNDAALRRICGVERHHGKNAIAFEDYDLSRQFFAARNVHNGDVNDGNGLLCRSLRVERTTDCQGQYESGERGAQAHLYSYDARAARHVTDRSCSIS